ncbi:DUF7168 domain-containing protein [Zavarzinia sp.]|uniref:DUF7168 domain-containing protein n=1 Tax=Zavarzinia sp. TaxID=2027920 RepID=UPI003BB79661
MADPDSIKAKLRALLAKTTAAGCTEPEAASAMAAAERIMATHGIDPDDIDSVDGERVSITRSKTKWPYSRVVFAIERISGATYRLTYSHRDPAGRLKVTLHFTGRPSDVALAEYLYVLLEWAIRRAQADFRATKTWRLKRSRKTRGEEMAAFTEGLCGRLAAKVLDVFRHRLPLQPAARTAVAAAEPELTKAEQDRARKTFRAWEKRIRRQGFWAGEAAADGINVTDAIAGEAAEPQMIGRQ